MPTSACMRPRLLAVGTAVGRTVWRPAGRHAVHARVPDWDRRARHGVAAGAGAVRSVASCVGARYEGALFVLECLVGTGAQDMMRHLP
eukprot:293961-Chlamydomonas_euryale.AAC.1